MGNTIVKAKEETLPMKIVFITHTSQRRSLATMRDFNGKYEISTHPVTNATQGHTLTQPQSAIYGHT